MCVAVCARVRITLRVCVCMRACVYVSLCASTYMSACVRVYACMCLISDGSCKFILNRGYLILNLTDHYSIYAF